MTAVHLLPPAVAAIARGRTEARRIICEPGQHSRERLEVAWMALTGAWRNPKCRRQQVNLGAAVPSREWPMSAVVIEAGAQGWGRE